ncbi:synaptonemal complex central element protein 3 [Alosa sapidissima]|uniref:synaptonemal complex central element protein 3 n=1 Tax=Alosa sapidissima TaxID=34773 RepID=UPI001C09E085|nr:synaptonemal complex central element protein 3 [Alosa sapidissima]
MMTDSGSELLMNYGQETLQLNKELEQMVETMENISVQLSWMAYDMVVLRTDPGHAQALRQLKEAHDLCDSVVRTQPTTTTTTI